MCLQGIIFWIPGMGWYKSLMWKAVMRVGWYTELFYAISLYLVFFPVLLSLYLVAFLLMFFGLVNVQVFNSTHWGQSICKCTSWNGVIVTPFARVRTLNTLVLLSEAWMTLCCDFPKHWHIILPAWEWLPVSVIPSWTKRKEWGNHMHTHTHTRVF